MRSANVNNYKGIIICTMMHNNETWISVDICCRYSGLILEIRKGIEDIEAVLMVPGRDGGQNSIQQNVE